MGWRWMFGSGVLPAGLFFVLLVSRARKPPLAHRARSGGSRPLPMLERSRRPETRPQPRCRKSDSCWPKRAARWHNFSSQACEPPLVIALVLAVLQQITGINVVLYYAPEIFKTAGVQGHPGHRRHGGRRRGEHAFHAGGDLDGRQAGPQAAAADRLGRHGHVSQHCWAVRLLCKDG